MRRSNTLLGFVFIVVFLTSAAYADVSAFVCKWKLDKEQSRIPNDANPYEMIVIRLDPKALFIARDGVEDLYLLNGKESKFSRVESIFLIKTKSYLTIMSETNFRINSKAVIGPSPALKKMGGKVEMEIRTIEYAQTWRLRNPTTLVLTDSRDDRELIYIKE